MKIRLDPSLKKLLDEAVEASGRSLNAEVCFRLAQSFGEMASDQQPDNEAPDLAGRVAELEKVVASMRAELDALRRK